MKTPQTTAKEIALTLAFTLWGGAVLWDGITRNPQQECTDHSALTSFKVKAGRVAEVVGGSAVEAVGLISVAQLALRRLEHSRTEQLLKILTGGNRP